MIIIDITLLSPVSNIMHGISMHSYFFNKLFNLSLAPSSLVKAIFAIDNNDDDDDDFSFTLYNIDFNDNDNSNNNNINNIIN